ncbi:MAG TPA: hypothetical protein VKU00_07270 [Chthonomonadaceae bacterium]|nr:hypothetical protein [Chthonomonadaceae bacterium]
MRINPTTRDWLGGLLVLGAGLLLAGCSGQGTGDTVPSPPRELVEKSFHPPAGGSQPSEAIGKPDSKSGKTTP